MSTIVENLKLVLANKYLVYLKTQNYHWNVTGPNFASIHLLLESQYEDLANSIDTIAERIRMLGELSPGTFTEFQKLSSFAEGNNKYSWEEMLRDLSNDNAKLVEIMKQAAKVAEQAKDDATLDLIVERINAHQKNIWMLNAHF